MSQKQFNWTARDIDNRLVDRRLNKITQQQAKSLPISNCFNQFQPKRTLFIRWLCFGFDDKAICLRFKHSFSFTPTSTSVRCVLVKIRGAVLERSGILVWDFGGDSFCLFLFVHFSFFMNKNRKKHSRS